MPQESTKRGRSVRFSLRWTISRWWVANHQVIPFSDALKVAQEFAVSAKLPKCIEWFEL
jgi:hypothetical protein